MFHEFLQENIPQGLPKNPFGRNSFVTVQKFIFYGSNSGKYRSEPYFSWRDTVKSVKNLFLTVLNSPKVRLQMRESGIEPYR